MTNFISAESIPQELISYRKILDVLNDKETEIELSSDAEINRDSRGRIVTANFYSVDNELYKQIFFDGNDITAINYFRNNKLSCKEIFEENKLVSKYIYRKTGQCVYEFHYEYSGNRLWRINKKSLNKDIMAEYTYDSLDRIINRKIYLNSKLVTEQMYNYDVLNRVVEYKDENQRIVVKSISIKNELLSYSITDKIDNEILVTNHFTELGYINTEFTLNGHSTTVKDTSYVDNVMLKRPCANEDDLDLIISGLYNCSANMPRNTDKEDIVRRNSMSLIDKNIELKTLPISIRKRVLYNIAQKSMQ